MPVQSTVFAQIMGLIDSGELNRCIEQYRGNAYVRRFTCPDQFLCMAFSQLAGKKSLWTKVFSLRQMRHKLYHMGIRDKVSLNTLSHASARRNWRIWQGFAPSLIVL